MSFDPDKLNYSGLSAKNLKKSDFTEEQIAASMVDDSMGILSRFSSGSSFFSTTKGKLIASFMLFPMMFVFVMTYMVFVKSYWILQLVAVLISIPILLFLFTFISKLIMNRRLRLLRFAIDNNLQYRCVGVAVPTEPIMFNSGHSKAVTDSISFGDGFMVSSYNYTIGSGKNSRTIFINFARIKLPRAVPHIYLNGIRNLVGATISDYETKKLSLEGDFNKYFVLYTPPDYHIDALQLLTPDVMATLKDFGADYDYELIGDYMYVYAPQNTVNSANNLNKFLSAVAAVSGQFIKQTVTYSDVRAGNVASGKVSIQGAKLVRKRWTLAVILPIVIVLLYFIFNITREPLMSSPNGILIAAMPMTMMIFITIVALVTSSKRK